MQTLLDRLTRLHSENPDPDFIAKGIQDPFCVLRNMSTLTKEEYQKFNTRKIALWDGRIGFSNTWLRPNYQVKAWTYDYFLTLGDRHKHWFIGLEYKHDVIEFPPTERSLAL